MMYILDTNILIYLIREDAIIQKTLSNIGIFSPQNAVSISIASVGEILSFARQNDWGDRKLKTVENLISSLNPIPIISRQLLDVYAEIDAFSKGKPSTFPIPTGRSSRTMGKNDLWIAATTHLTQSTLITTDGDFDHLNGLYFPVIKLTTKV